MNHDEGTKGERRKEITTVAIVTGENPRDQVERETLIEDRVPSRNLRACIRSAENPMLNLTSRTFQVAVKRIRYAQS